MDPARFHAGAPQARLDVDLDLTPVAASGAASGPPVALAVPLPRLEPADRAVIIQHRLERGARAAHVDEHDGASVIVAQHEAGERAEIERAELAGTGAGDGSERVERALDRSRGDARASDEHRDIGAVMGLERLDAGLRLTGRLIEDGLRDVLGDTLGVH